MKFHLFIYEEHAGDIQLEVEVSGETLDDVTYDEDEVSEAVGLPTVPDSVDKDIREKAIDMLMYDPDIRHMWEEEQEDFRQEARFEHWRERDL